MKMEEIVYILLVFVFIILILNVCIFVLLFLVFKKNEEIINLNEKLIEFNKDKFSEIAYYIEIISNQLHENHEKLLLMRLKINDIRSRQSKFSDEIKVLKEIRFQKKSKKINRLRKKR